MKRALFESDASVYNKVRALKADARRGGVAEAGELTDFYSVTTVGEALVKTLNTLQRDGRLDTDTARMLMQNFNSVMVPTSESICLQHLAYAPDFLSPRLSPPPPRNQSTR